MDMPISIQCISNFTGPNSRPEIREIEPFAHRLAGLGLKLTRHQTSTLQVNLGARCNQTCDHCHHQAGPSRQESMSLETVEEVIAYAGRGKFITVDITGGAPELNPHLYMLIEELDPSGVKIILRTNLTASHEGEREKFIKFLTSHRVVIMASFPGQTLLEAAAQRSPERLAAILSTLQMLNQAGYGPQGAGLELDLVVNPAGLDIPRPQAETEKHLRFELSEKYGLFFDKLFVLTNVPLGRFRRRLDEGKAENSYLYKLAGAFNPQTVTGLMCQSQVTVSWEGLLYDCDFNLAANLPLGGQERHIRELSGPPEVGSPIMTDQHCYACMAGAGFT